MSSNENKSVTRSIDGILENLIVRERTDRQDLSYQEIDEWKRKLSEYEKIGSLDELRKEKISLLEDISELKREQSRYLSLISEGKTKIQIIDKEIVAINNQKEEAIKQLERIRENGDLSDNGVIEVFNNQKQRRCDYSRETEEMTYRPSSVISQYCQQPMGKRKLTVHLREIDYQAIIKASGHLESNKGRFMETITKALRAYISKEHYEEAEKELYNKVLQSARELLKHNLIPTDDI